MVTHPKEIAFFQRARGRQSRGGQEHPHPPTDCRRARRKRKPQVQRTRGRSTGRFEELSK